MNASATDATRLSPMSVPSPKTPSVINKKSQRKQVSTMGNTRQRLSPCFNTKAFCAPMATISPPETRKPCSSAFIKTSQKALL